MKKQLDQVTEFQKTYGRTVNESPSFLSNTLFNLRSELLREENEEYLEACENNNLVEIADALGDSLYIILGTIIAHGMQYKIEEIFDEIHRSNMSKLGEDGKPIYREDGKILKGKNYSKPDLSGILK